MFRTAICLALVFSAGCEGSDQRRQRAARETAGRCLAAGRQAWKDGDRDGALKQFSRAIAVLPSASGYYERAKANWKLQEFDSCQADIEKGLELNASHDGLNNLRTRLRNEKSEFARQIAATERETQQRQAKLEADRAEQERREKAEQREQEMAKKEAARRAANEEKQATQIAFESALRNLPPAIQLPSGSGDKATLALPGIPAGGAGYELGLSGDPQFELKPQASADRGWMVFRRNDRVGTFSLNGNTRLEFSWEETPGNVTNSLRFCVLQIRGAGQSQDVALRLPLNRPPVDVDFSKEVSFQTLPITDADAEDLMLDFIALDGIEGQASPARVKFNEPMHIVLASSARAGDKTGNGSGEAGVELALRLVKKKGQPTLQMNPYILDTNGKNVPLSLDRLDAMKKATEREYPKLQAKFEGLQSEYMENQQMIAACNARLEQQPLPLLPMHPGFNSLSRLNPRDPAEKEKLHIMIGLHLDALNKAEQSLKVVGKHLAKMEARTSMLPKLMEVGSNANDRAYVKLRVLTTSGGREVELLSMTETDSSKSTYAPGGSGRSSLKTGAK